MKLTIIGGGGFRVPQVYEALASLDSTVDIKELCLYDVSPARMKKIGEVIEQISSHSGKRVDVSYTTDLTEALTGADFIFSAMRVGGIETRVLDERIALSRGVLGQETVGAGGLAYALRTLPQATALANRIKELAPEAWVINFTNPAGVITEGMRSVLGERVVGICDTPIGLMRRVSRVAVPEGVDFDFDYVGINHLGWLRAIEVGGINVLPALIQDDEKLATIEEARVMGFDWVKAIGAIPNEYLFYYYFALEAVERIQLSQETRGEYLVEHQGHFYGERQAATLDSWSRIMHERESSYMKESRDGSSGVSRLNEDAADGGYQKVALDLMSGLSGGASERMILNVPNLSAGGQRLVPELNDEAVIEVPCTVSENEIRPKKVLPVSGEMIGLMMQVKSSEQLILRAAREGSFDLAWKAFATHPLIDSVNIGKELLQAYIAEIPAIAKVFEK